VLAGWSSNNKYATMGGIRSTAQMVSYELALGLSVVGPLMLAGSMSMLDIADAQSGVWYIFLQPLAAIIFYLAALAEVNRAPFDMPEAEQELTAGYHTEYSGMKFALFFMAEYQKMIIVSAILATLFFGGYREFWFLKDTFLSVDAVWKIGSWQTTAWFLGPIYMLAKIVVLLGIMIWVRASWPRIRYNRLMAFGWKVLLPLALAVVFITAIGILLAQDVHPWLLWLTPILSLIAGAIATLLLERSLRRKTYA
jgi:NADH-quinone oxidoreductase subunit H